MTIPRSAAFMRSLVDLAGKQAVVQRTVRDAATLHLFEQENKAALEDAFTRIAVAARGGAVRMPLQKDDFLETAEARAYMQQKGFQYTSRWHNDLSAIEWWSVEDPNPKQLK